MGKCPVMSFHGIAFGHNTSVTVLLKPFVSVFSIKFLSRRLKFSGIVVNVSKNHSAFIFTVKNSKIIPYAVVSSLFAHSDLAPTVTSHIIKLDY